MPTLSTSSGKIFAGSRFVGRFSTTPSVPSVSCRSTSTTAFAKLGSVRSGDATSSVPLVTSCDAAGSEPAEITPAASASQVVCNALRKSFRIGPS